MENFIDKMLFERFSIRNTVLKSDHYFNQIMRGVNKLYRKGLPFDSNDDLTLIELNDKKFVFYLSKNEKTLNNTIFVFCFNVKDLIDLTGIKMLSSDRDIENIGQFIMSVPFLEDINSNVDIIKTIEDNNLKIDKFYNGDVEKSAFGKNFMLNLFFMVSYQYSSSKMSEFFKLLHSNDNLPFGMYDIFKSSLLSNVATGENKVKGLISRINAVNTFATKKYQEAYYIHKVKNDGRFLYIKSESSLIVAEIDDGNVNIFHVDKKLPMKKVKEHDVSEDGIYNVIIKMKDRKVEFFNPSLYKTFSVYLNNVYQTLLSQGDISPEFYAENYYDFEYQKNKHCHEFGDKNQFNYVSDMLLNSRQRSYVPEKMCFADNQESFIELESEEDEPSESYNITYVSNSEPLNKTLFKLNDDWLNAVRYLLTIMNNEKVSISSHYSKSEDDAKKEIVEYLKNLIEFNKK